MDQFKGKVAIFVTQLEAGGAQRAAFSLSEGLRKRGYQTKMCFFYEKKKAFEQEDFEVFLEKVPNLKSLFTLMMKLWNFFKEEKPDSVVTFTYYANILVQLIAYLRRVPVRIASQRNPSNTYPYLAKYLDMIIGSTDIYTNNVMVSKSVLRSFSGYPLSYQKKCSVVYNGVKSIHTDVNKYDLRKTLGLPIDKFMIVSVGRLWPQKNHSLLIDVVKEIDGIFLLIVGDGSLKEALKERALGYEDRIQFIGQIDTSRVRHYLGACDLFALPSFYEGMSNALLEALSTGLPILVSDIPEQLEVVKGEHKTYGIALPPSSKLLWKKAILKIKSNTRMATRLSELALQRSRDFSLNEMVDKFEVLLRNGSKN